MSNENLTDYSNQFQDKIAVITGSTQGSGAETARLFARRGAKGITICGRNEEKGLSVKKQIEDIGSQCIYVKADLANINDCRKIISETEKTFGTIHNLVNVAAFTERGTILSTTMENYDQCFNVNTRAPFILMQESIKIMIRDKINGTIANVLSMAVYSGMPFLTAYSSSKGALAVMIKNVANSIRAHQIRINGINLGWTDTPAEDSIQKKFHNGGDDWLEKAEKDLPFKRLIKPIDVAKMIAFLCSDESGVMTGSLIDFDQSVLGWHSYSVYESKKLEDSLLGE